MKKFNMIDESFICENCGKKVTKLGYTARDHCPYCLYSKHLDINPGDRECTCHGLMKPIGIEKYKNSYKIIYNLQTTSIHLTVARCLKPYIIGHSANYSVNTIG